VRLRRIDRDNEHRREAAAYYDAELAGTVRTPTTSGKSTYHLYVVQHERASELVGVLHAAGVGSGVYYPEPLHVQPAFARYATERLPVAEGVAGKTFALPCHQNITRAEQDEVIAVLRQILA
jgi:dTDP-4-amino-4,6-dideoxygalactose transaminase